MPTLVVLRHAKADNPTGVADFNRPLRQRGKDDARAAGLWLRETVGRLDLLACSPARRTMQTVAEVLVAYRDDPPEVSYRQELYEASVGNLLDVVTGLPARVEVAVLIGHNPSVSTLVTLLTGQATGLRTSGIAVLRLDCAWQLAGPGVGALLSTATPRAG